tara:strand:- start:137 stop:412 length:276 start_codon:yes stop_codon:yes gene_type:complete
MNETKKVPPILMLYLKTLDILSTMDEIDFPENGFKKSVRTINAMAKENSETLDSMMPDALERVVHNYNVVQGIVDVKLLETPLGDLKISEV